MSLKKLLQHSSLLKVFKKRANRRCIGTSQIKELEDHKCHFSLKHQTSIAKPISNEVIDNFEAYFPTFLKLVLDDPLFKHMSSFDKTRLEKMLVYNLPNGYRRTPFIMLSSYYDLAEAKTFNAGKLDLVYLMAWCIHALQWSYQILDDIADETETRANKPCWYKRKDVGLRAINDGALLHVLIPEIIRRHFSGHKHQSDMPRLFRAVSLSSAVGQQMDLTKCPLSLVNIGRWTNIVHNKTSWHQSVLPIKTALYLSETYDSKTFATIEPLLMDFGILFQMTNDYLDGFPTKALPGSNATDIQEGKCTWLLVHALKFCSPSQRNVLEENYGRRDQSSVKAVIDVYIELGLKEYGERYQEQFFQEMLNRIHQLPDKHLKKVLINGLSVGHQGY